ncbi:MAG: 2-C-methyl-D-erythritol 2,4-cyclodiphosphate synthase [Gaiellales bacterium]
MSELRVGLGVDAHAFADGIPLVLAGIQFDEDRGLAGHSDGDVVTHAVIDALLGAAGLGDIGSLFPSEDDSLRGVSSLLLLRNAYGKVTNAGFELVNANCVLIGEQPRIVDRRDDMRARLAETMGVEVGRIGLHATTTDRLGFAGRGEGLAAQAVALLRQAG